MRKQWKRWQTIFLGSQITADGECSHEIKRCLLLGRKATTHQDSIIKSRDITLLTKIRLVKAMVFSSSHVWMWELEYKESWAPKNWCYWLWCWRRLLGDPWTAKEIKPVNPKGNQSWIFTRRIDAEAEAPVLMATWCEEQTDWKGPWCLERLKTGGEGDDRGWDGWMASQNRWTWVWASYWSWWLTGKPGMLQSMGSERVEYDWTTRLTGLVLISSSFVKDLPFAHLKKWSYLIDLWDFIYIYIWVEVLCWIYILKISSPVSWLACSLSYWYLLMKLSFNLSSV